MMFHCRRWVISRLRCWRRCWWGRSSCFIQVNMRVMMIAVNTSLASPRPLSVCHSLCCPQCAGVGGGHSVAGRSHRLVTGSVINSRDWLQVSVQCKLKPSVILTQITSVMDRRSNKSIAKQASSGHSNSQRAQAKFKGKRHWQSEI